MINPIHELWHWIVGRVVSQEEIEALIAEANERLNDPDDDSLESARLGMPDRSVRRFD